MPDTADQSIPAAESIATDQGATGTPANASATSNHASPGTSSVPKIDRVLDVSLAVTLRFGQRQLTLGELLELSTGSLVELDRQVEEPVDLILGDRIIARGEVVIVDGNYGLRVTHVIDNPARFNQAALSFPTSTTQTAS